ncbi:MAG: hypothetical protein WB985_09865 [Candidatus Acidiferrales bacterium]
MKKLAAFAVVVACGWPFASGQQQAANPASAPLSVEAAQIYGAFLDSYVGTGQRQVKLVETTSVFQVSDSEKTTPCIKHFEPEALDEKSQTIHVFDAALINGRSIQLVNPAATKIEDPEDAMKKGVSVDDALKASFAAGQLRLSEIVFNKAHTFAIFSYAFHCGRLCGSGGNVLFERSKKVWVRSEEGCGTWIS